MALALGSAAHAREHRPGLHLRRGAAAGDHLVAGLQVAGDGLDLGEAAVGGADTDRRGYELVVPQQINDAGLHAAAPPALELRLHLGAQRLVLRLLVRREIRLVLGPALLCARAPAV